MCTRANLSVHRQFQAAFAILQTSAHNVQWHEAWEENIIEFKIEF